MIFSFNDFRRIALGMTGAIESAHMGHPDFRVNGRTFATIHSDHQGGMVKLPPDEQQKFVGEHPAAFAPENGAWGRAGCTKVQFDSVDEDTLGEAMTLAWRNASGMPPAKAAKPRRRPAPKPPSGTR
jgi:hypothetical protein